MTTIPKRYIFGSGILIMLGIVIGMAIVLTTHFADAHSELSPELLRDMQTMADNKGITLEEAVDRYAWHGQFGVLIGELRNAHAGAYADAHVTGNEAAKIEFAGAVPSSAQAKIEAFTDSHTNVAVTTAHNQGYTESERITALEAAHYALLARDEVEHIITTFDRDTDTIKSTVTLSSDTEPTAIGILKGVAEAKITEVTREGIGLNAKVVDGGDQVLSANDNNDAHQGGEKLSVNFQYVCTSGFGTKSDNGTRGVATAGHCPDEVLRDDGDTLSYGDDDVGSNGDFQWNYGPDTEGNDFYAGDPTTTETDSRESLSVAYPFNGAEFCQNGAITKQKCQDVRQTNICDDDVCKLAQMERRYSAPGDSGGPVYVGTAAVGIHRGKMLSDGQWRDTFSIAWFMGDAIDVDVATD